MSLMYKNSEFYYILKMFVEQESVRSVKSYELFKTSKV